MNNMEMKEPLLEGHRPESPTRLEEEEKRFF